MIAFFYDSCSLILKFLLPGIFLGVVYDIFRLFRIGRNDKKYSVRDAIKKRFGRKSNAKIKPKRKISIDLLVFLEDILFFLIVSLTEILSVYHINGGEIRIYGLLFSFLGFIIYQKTISALIIFLSKKILYAIRKLVYGCICFFLIPILFFAKIGFRLIEPIYQKIRKRSKMKNSKDCIKKYEG